MLLIDCPNELERRGMVEKEKYTLAQRRKLRGFFQEELAKKAGLTSRTIINYESGGKNSLNASYKTIQKLADVLDIKLSQIFSGDTS